MGWCIQKHCSADHRHGGDGIAFRFVTIFGSSTSFRDLKLLIGCKYLLVLLIDIIYWLLFIGKYLFIVKIFL